jgi:hypothetical protein
MVQDITRKCLSDLVRDWQTSEFANPGSYQSASQAAGPIHKAYSPHHPTDLDENPSLGENSDLNTKNRQSEMLIPSHTKSSFNHLHFLRSVEDNVGTQNEEWMYQMASDLTMCNDSNPFLVGHSISGATFCLETPHIQTLRDTTARERNRKISRLEDRISCVRSASERPEFPIG